MGAARWAWLRAMEERADAEWPTLRRDHRETLLTILRAMAWAVDPETMLTRPTIDRLMKVTGRSERSVQRWLRWIESTPLVEVTEPGTTPRFRPGILRDSQRRKLAREWRLTPPGQDRAEGACVPRGHPYGSVSCSGSDPVVLDRNPPTRARERAPRHLRRRRQREGQGQNDRRSAPGSLPRPSMVPQAPMWPLERNPRRRPQVLAAARSLQAAYPVLTGPSVHKLRSVLRRYFAAGWTPEDVIWHAEHERDGAPITCEDAVRHPAGWLARRLARWTGPDGTPLPPRSAQRASARERKLADQERSREQRRAAAAQRAAAPAAYANEVRARHGWPAHTVAVTRLSGA